MKKVGICTINDNNNYGNRLQNYATQELLKKNGFQPETIINTTIHFKKEKITLNNFFPRLINKINNKKNRILSKNSKRKKCFDDFNKNIDFYSKTIDDECVKDEKINKEINSYFDAFFTGSDQVWNPTFPRTSNIDFLTFTDNYKRNSFSASFGIHDIPTEDEIKYKDLLISIKNISVREDRGKEIIKKITGRDDVEILVDPTMALDTSEWNTIIKKPKQLEGFKNKKYILNYFLGNLSKERKKEIKRIARDNNCMVINILDKKSPFYQTGPSEFLWLEKNAFLICTDSFHSSVFAILFNRPFIVFNREDELENMNSRLETLLSKFELNDRYYNGKITDELLSVDYTKTYKLLELERKKANDFINRCLNSEGENT